MIRTQRRGAVAVVTLDRPDRRNALDSEHLAGLTDAFASLDDARVLVIAGEGRAFCAGADLTHVEDADAAAEVGRMLRALLALPICTIAAVEGPAFGAGMQLSVACDLRVVGERASFAVPAAKLGLMVDHWTMDRVAHLVGGGTARAIFLAADVVDREAALRLGLAQREGTLDDAIAWAETIADLAPLSVAGAKLALDRLSGRDLDDPVVAAAFTRCWTSEDRLEGIAAFQEKRRPNFQGR